MKKAPTKTCKCLIFLVGRVGVLPVVARLTCGELVEPYLW